MKYLSILLLPLLMIACYDEPDWLGDNTTSDGNNFPVVSTFSIVGSSTVASGDPVQFDLRYWSIQPIQNLQLIQLEADGTTEVNIETRDYVFNFNEETQNEQVVFDYAAPTVSDTTVVTFIGRVLNENGLSKDGSVELTVVP